MCAVQSVDEAWFHGKLTRDDAKQRLGEHGDFLVRTSRERPGEYILTVHWNSEILNFVCPRTEASALSSALEPCNTAFDSGTYGTVWSIRRGP